MLAIIGDDDNILAFKAGGVDAYFAVDEQEARTTLRTIAKKYDVIFITERLAERLSEYLARFNENAYPVILPLPESAEGYGMTRLRAAAEAALGVDILFGREEK